MGVTVVNTIASFVTFPGLEKWHGGSRVWRGALNTITHALFGASLSLQTATRQETTKDH